MLQPSLSLDQCSETMTKGCFKSNAWSKEFNSKKNQGQPEIIRSPCTLKEVSLIIKVYNKTIKKLLQALLCLPNLVRG